MKKRKETKEQSTQQPTEQSTQQSTEQSNDTYVYGVGILAVLAIGVCAFFAYNTFPKKQANEKKGSTTKTTSYALKSLYNKWLVLIGKRTLKTPLRID